MHIRYPYANHKLCTMPLRKNSGGFDVIVHLLLTSSFEEALIPWYVIMIELCFFKSLLQAYLFTNLSDEIAYSCRELLKFSLICSTHSTHKNKVYKKMRLKWSKS